MEYGILHGNERKTACTYAQYYFKDDITAFKRAVSHYMLVVVPVCDDLSNG